VEEKMSKSKLVKMVCIGLIGCSVYADATEVQEKSEKEAVDHSTSTALAENMMSQSPIDIVNSVEREMQKSVTFKYKGNLATIENLGHTVQLGVTKGQMIMVNDKEFELLQIHFHHDSEHVIGGKSYPVEAHFVHKSKDGKLAVVGVLYEEGKTNASFEALGKLPKKRGEKRAFKANINAMDLMPASKSFYTYSGSLTTPPYTEEVTWVVLKDSPELSKNQIGMVQRAMHKNNRDIQAINGREIIEKD
jgi:carbonic anhydrase